MDCDETPVMVECRECGEIYNADDNTHDIFDYAHTCPFCGAVNE